MKKKAQKLFNLNIGCGESKLDGFINVDLEKKTKPDLLHDIRLANLPIKDETIKLIHCIHNVEHIEFKHWERVFNDFWRVLVPGGVLRLAYPEFERCAKYFLENHRGKKDFFRMTLYGRQLYPGDYHVTPVVTRDLIEFLKNAGFDEFRFAPEPEEYHNTFLECKKGSKGISREQLFKDHMDKNRKKRK